MVPTATPVTYGLDAAIARFSVARYQKMIETGILTTEDKVELLENYVVLKIEVYTEPSGPTAAPAFNVVQTYQTGDVVRLSLDGQTVATIPVADMLP